MPDPSVDTVAALVQRAYRFALSPTAVQEDAFSSHAGGVRYAYNWGVQTIAEAHNAYSAAKAAGDPTLPEIPQHFGLCKLWTAYKDTYRDTPPPGRDHDLSWVGENFVGSYQAALRDAAGAWKKFHDSRTGRRAGRRMGRPKFKSRHRSPAKFQVHGDSLRLIDKATINLPKIGPVRIPGRVFLGDGRPRSRPAGVQWVDRNARTARKLVRLLDKSRTAGPATCPLCAGTGTKVVQVQVKGQPRGVTEPVERKCKDLTVERARIVRATISRGASGTWWCSVTAELLVDIPKAPSKRRTAGGIVGVDLGVRHIATLSTGEAWEASRALRDRLADLRVEQRHLSRTQGDSRNRVKARRRVGTLHEQVAAMRADALHRVSNAIVARFAKIVTEGHDLQQMAQRGSKAVPVKVRRARNLALADTAAGILRWHLEYKTSWSGTTFVKVDKGVATGRTCSQCGRTRAKPVALTEEQFHGDCGHVLDRRVNTARHLAQIGRGDTGSGGTTPPGQPRGGGVRPDPGSSRGGHPSVKRAAHREVGSPGP